MSKSETVFEWQNLSGVHPDDREGFRSRMFAIRRASPYYAADTAHDYARISFAITPEFARQGIGFNVIGPIREAILARLERGQIREILSIDSERIVFGDSFITSKGI